MLKFWKWNLCQRAGLVEDYVSQWLLGFETYSLRSPGSNQCLARLGSVAGLLWTAYHHGSFMTMLQQCHDKFVALPGNSHRAAMPLPWSDVDLPAQGHRRGSAIAFKDYGMDRASRPRIYKNMEKTWQGILQKYDFWGSDLGREPQNVLKMRKYYE